MSYECCKETVKRNKLIMAINQEDIYMLYVGRKDANIKDNVIVFIGVEHIFVLPAGLRWVPEEITDEELDDMFANYDILLDFPMEKEFMDGIIGTLRQQNLDHRKEFFAEIREYQKCKLAEERKLEEERRLERKKERERRKAKK